MDSHIVHCWFSVVCDNLWTMTFGQSVYFHTKCIKRNMGKTYLNLKNRHACFSIFSSHFQVKKKTFSVKVFPHHSHLSPSFCLPNFMRKPADALPWHRPPSSSIPVCQIKMQIKLSLIVIHVHAYNTSILLISIIINFLFVSMGFWELQKFFLVSLHHLIKPCNVIIEDIVICVILLLIYLLTCFGR